MLSLATEEESREILFGFTQEEGCAVSRCSGSF